MNCELLGIKEEKREREKGGNLNEKEISSELCLLR